MKAFGYLIATAALIPGAVAQLKPAAFNLLANGWRYKGCYTDLGTASTTNHALGAYLYSFYNPNGGVVCSNNCLRFGYKYAGTKYGECWCDNVINRNNTLTAGQLSPDLACQSACRGNPSEACGTVDTFMSIYEYTVSGFLKTACVPVCLCFALFGRSVEQPSARWRDMFREEPVEELGLGEHGLGEGGCWRGPYVGIPGPHAFHPYPCLYPQRDQYISDASIRCPH